jgi:uncharacterized RDD family membrane protein YckC
LWRRAAAFAFDVGVCSVPLLFFAHADAPAVVLPLLAYGTISVWRWGRTIGMSLTNARVVRASGERISLLRAFVRTLAFVLLSTFVIFALLVMCVALDPALLTDVPTAAVVLVVVVLGAIVSLRAYRRGWCLPHDRLAGTIVVSVTPDAREGVPFRARVANALLLLSVCLSVYPGTKWLGEMEATLRDLGLRAKAPLEWALVPAFHAFHFWRTTSFLKLLDPLPWVLVGVAVWAGFSLLSAHRVISSPWTRRLGVLVSLSWLVILGFAVTVTWPLLTAAEPPRLSAWPIAGIPGAIAVVSAAAALLVPRQRHSDTAP